MPKPLQGVECQAGVRAREINDSQTLQRLTHACVRARLAGRSC